MHKYEIFAGLTNRNDPPSHGIYEFRNEQEANIYAYQLAVEDYQSYEGYYGILDWDECKEDLQESGMLDDLTEDEIEEENDKKEMVHKTNTIIMSVNVSSKESSL